MLLGHGEVYYENGTRKQAVLCRFVSWGARDRFFSARKESRFYMKANLTPRRTETLACAQQEVGDLNSRAHDLLLYVYADRNCKLDAAYNDNTGKKRHLGFSTSEEFDRQLDFIANTKSPYIETFSLMDHNDELLGLL